MNMKLTKGIVLLGLGIAVVVLFLKQGSSLIPARQLTPLTPAIGDGVGNSLVASAAAHLVQSPPFEAELRQESRLYGVALSAPGRYLQQGQGSGKFRLELKTSIDGQVATMLRVSDGRFLYSRIALPESTTLTRLDLDSIDTTLAEHIPRSSGDITKSKTTTPTNTPWMFGGLPFLLEELHQDFSFSAPQESQLGETPVWTLAGTWKREAAQRIYLMRTGQSLADDADLREALPEQLPTSVELVLGRGGNLDLFPIQIRFLRDGVSVEHALRPNDNVIASIEFQRVAFNVTLDDVAFNYDAGDEEVEYRTAEYQQTLEARFPHVLIPGSASSQETVR